ncbi:hypothetical protein HanIR_Chr11g0539011 [Helianthus annuus]|nr:hypothetical protein HanIR_Chr11g0539011 [Helianthus annuus]
MQLSSSFPPNTHHRSPPATHPPSSVNHPSGTTKHRSRPPYCQKEEDLLVCGSDVKRRRD